MTYTLSVKLTLCAGAMIVLAGCATSTPLSKTAANTVVVAAPAATPVEATSGFTINYVKSTSAKEDQICKRQDIIGSRFKRTICATEAEWENLATENRVAMRDLLRKSSQQTAGN
jgi:hypothetical protein